MEEVSVGNLWIAEFSARQQRFDPARHQEWRRALGAAHGHLIEELRGLTGADRYRPLKHPSGSSSVNAGPDRLYGPAQDFTAQGGWAMALFDLPFSEWFSTLEAITVAQPLTPVTDARRTLIAQLAAAEDRFALSVEPRTRAVEALWDDGLTLSWLWETEQFHVRAADRVLKHARATTQRRVEQTAWEDGKRWLTLAVVLISTGQQRLSEALGAATAAAAAPRLSGEVAAVYGLAS